MLACSLYNQGNQKFEVIALQSVLGRSSSTTQTRWLLPGLQKRNSRPPHRSELMPPIRQVIMCECYFANKRCPPQDPGCHQVVFWCFECLACTNIINQQLWTTHVARIITSRGCGLYPSRDAFDEVLSSPERRMMAGKALSASGYIGILDGIQADQDALRLFFNLDRGLPAIV